jgi:hypothetical protein
MVLRLSFTFQNRSMKTTAAAIVLPLASAPVFWLLSSAALPVARAALTPTMHEAFQHGTNGPGHVVICDGRIGCTNSAHLHFYRRGNGTNDGIASGGSVGIRTNH